MRPSTLASSVNPASMPRGYLDSAADLAVWAYSRGMLFVLGTLGIFPLIVGILLLVGHYSPGSSGELIDWRPTRSPAVEAQNEIDDVRQMLGAQNESRRRRGAPEMTEADLDAAVAEDERLRLRGRGRFGEG